MLLYLVFQAHDGGSPLLAAKDVEDNRENREGTLILQLLSENLARWNKETAASGHSIGNNKNVDNIASNA